MNLIWNWRAVLTKAWSVRFIIAAGILSGAEATLPLFVTGLQPGMFAAVSSLLTAAALVARLLAQKGISE